MTMKLSTLLSADKSEDHKARLAELSSNPQNGRCADCGDLRPTWCSLVLPPADAPPESPTIGLFCCLHCSVAHRELGTRFCTVKSVKLDDWDENDLHAVEIGGNLRVNSIFEGSMYNDTDKPSPLAEATDRLRFIHDKYVRLKYFIPKAYEAVGTEGEDEDETVVTEDGKIRISVLPAATAGRLASITEDVPHGLSRLSSLKNINGVPDRRSLMHRQASLPELTTSRLSMNEGFAKPFRPEMDVWESMNNSTWCDLTFEESLHKKTMFDFATKDKRDSWGFSGHALKLDSEHEGSNAKSDKREKRGKGDRRGMMMKKASSERNFSSNSFPTQSLTKSSAEDLKKLDRRPMLSRATKSASTRSLSSGRKKRRDDDSKVNGKKERPSRSSSDNNSNEGDILRVLEHANKNRLAGDDGAIKLPLRQRSGPLRKAQSLRDVNGSTRSSSAGRRTTRRHLKPVSMEEDPAGEETQKSRSASPKTHRKKSRDESTRTSSSGSSRRHGSQSGGSSSSSSTALRRHQSLQESSQDSSGEDKSDSPRRARSYDGPKSRRRHKEGLSSSEPVSPPTCDSETPDGTHSRKALKMKTPKSARSRTQSRSLLQAMANCPNSAPIPAKLERSLSHKLLSETSRSRRTGSKRDLLKGVDIELEEDESVDTDYLAKSKNQRPRSHDALAKSRARRAAARAARNADLSATEHSPSAKQDQAMFEHPLFSYPVSLS